MADTISVEKIWTIRGLDSGRTLDGWFGMDEYDTCPIDISYLELQEEEWGERVVIQLGYGVLRDKVSNVGKKWFYETKNEAIKDNLDIL